MQPRGRLRRRGRRGSSNAIPMVTAVTVPARCTGRPTQTGARIQASGGIVDSGARARPPVDGGARARPVRSRTIQGWSASQPRSSADLRRQVWPSSGESNDDIARLSRGRPPVPDARPNPSRFAAHSKAGGGRGRSARPSSRSLTSRPHMLYFGGEAEGSSHQPADRRSVPRDRWRAALSPPCQLGFEGTAGEHFGDGGRTGDGPRDVDPGEEAGWPVPWAWAQHLCHRI